MGPIVLEILPVRSEDIGAASGIDEEVPALVHEADMRLIRMAVASAKRPGMEP